MVFITSIMVGANNIPVDINGIQPDVIIGNNEGFYNSITDESKKKEAVESDSKLQLGEALNYLNSKKVKG